MGKSSKAMKKIAVWIDPDWSPGGIHWDLQSKGMAKIYAEQGMNTWVKATLTIEPTYPKKTSIRTSSKILDK